MAENDLNIKVGVDSSEVKQAAQDVENLGGKVEELGGSVEKGEAKVGGLRKEMRATTEAASSLGEAFGAQSEAMKGVGEGSRMVYAGIELMNGALLELGKTILLNPLFLLAGVIAGTVLAIKSMNDANKEMAKEVDEVSESIENYVDEVRHMDDAAAAAADALKVSLGKLSKAQAERNKINREANNKETEEGKKYAKELAKALVELDLVRAKFGGAGYHMTKEDYETLHKNEKAVEDAEKAHTQAIVDIYSESRDAKALVDNEEKKENEKKLKEANKKAIEETKKRYEKELKDYKTHLKVVVETTKEGTVDRLQAEEKALDDENQYLKDHSKQLISSGIMTQDEITLNIEENINKRDKIEKDYQEKNSKDNYDYYKNIAKDYNDAQKKKLEDLKKHYEDLLKEDEKRVKSLKDIKDKTFQNVQDEADAETKLENDKYNELVALGQATEEATLAHQQTLTNIQKDATAERVKIMDSEMAAATSFISGLSSLGQTLASNSKEAAEIQKDAALVQIGIDEAKAISALIAASNGNPLNLLTGGAAGIVQFATGFASITSGILKAKQLLNTDAGGSTTNTSSISKPTSSAPTSAPQFTAPQFFGLGQGSPQASQSQQQPTIVVGVDQITKVTKQVNVIQNASSYGLSNAS